MSFVGTRPQISKIECYNEFEIVRNKINKDWDKFINNEKNHKPDESWTDVGTTGPW